MAINQVRNFHHSIDVSWVQKSRNDDQAQDKKQLSEDALIHICDYGKQLYAVSI